jgi:sterol carrier protein 2
MGLSMRMMADTPGISSSPPNALYFANAGLEYMEKYGAEARDFAEIARISYAHSAKHPYAQLRDLYTLEQIEKAPITHFPLAKLQCSPTSDGAEAAVLMSQKFWDERSHSPQLYSKSSMDLAGYDMTKRAAQAALNEAGVSAKDIKLLNPTAASPQMSFFFSKAWASANRKSTYDGAEWRHYGRWQKTHHQSFWRSYQQRPSTWRNRPRTEDTDVALQHNLGLGETVVLNIYKRTDGNKNVEMSDEEIMKMSQFDYNPAKEAR